MASSTIAVGVSTSSEVIWKGEKATVLRGLISVPPKKFVRCSKDKYSDLAIFLAPSASARKAAFGKTRLFENLAALRNALTESLRNELRKAAQVDGEQEDDAASGSHDPTALLGLDGAAAQPRAPGRKELRRQEKVIRDQLPPFGVVKYAPAGEEPWEVAVLLDTGVASRKAVAVELSAKNLERMRGFLAMEMASAGVDVKASRKASGSSGPPAGGEVKASRKASGPGAKEPRGKPGDREYFLPSANKWVRKILEQGGKDGVRKYRQLTRNGTPVDHPAALAPPPEVDERTEPDALGALLEAAASGKDDAESDDPILALGL